MKPGDYFLVHDGRIMIPEGGFVCMYALHSLLPVITPKERKICEEKDADWVWRVHHAQCPDPKGRVIFKIDRLTEDLSSLVAGHLTEPRLSTSDEEHPTEPLYDLRVVVEEVKGNCTSGMQPGDYFMLRSGRLYIPAERHFCLYALQAVIPLLPAKQRRLDDGDWLKEDSRVICPDPAGNVIMRIERCA
jgi:uncharacterized repeat protein (TIGR04076 family)